MRPLRGIAALLLSAWAVPGSVGLATGIPGPWEKSGRLFSTPEMRQRLDRLRQGVVDPEPRAVVEQPPAASPPTAPEETAEKPIPPATPKEGQGPLLLSLGGLLRRDDGRCVAWLDGKPVEVGHGFDGVGYRVLPSCDPARGLAIRTATSERTLYLKSGQVLNLTDQQIREGRRPPQPPPEETVKTAAKTTEESAAREKKPTVPVPDEKGESMSQETIAELSKRLESMMGSGGFGSIFNMLKDLQHVLNGPKP
ncbi:MAG: hypothetical protein HQL56_10895 [Magnetococcales bacterium]|nr:hypothetical protein [Magnetococcales bacterium]